MNRRLLNIIFGTSFLLLGVLIISLFFSPSQKKSTTLKEALPATNPLLSPTATIIPTPKSFTFVEMNAKYGPCTQTPVLMYHHIQSDADAALKKQGSLSVDPKNLRLHFQYLKDKNYSVISPKDLINFFDNATALPAKSIMITLDDAYEDNYFNAFPLLKEFGFSATIFTPTGLVSVPDYLNWDEINQMKSQIYFANHTWSHHASAGTIEVLKNEISLADTQLSDRGLNIDKVFAYPYGKPSTNAEGVLKELNYKLAFTTTHGSVLCKSQRLTLPRIRAGNSPLSKYGL